jgi:hypothetical protein
VTEGAFTVTLTVSNGTLSSTQTAPLATVAPNSGAAGITNVGQSTTVVINPEDLLAIDMPVSNGGALELQIDTSKLRSAVSLSTEFDGIGVRSGAVPGVVPINKFTSPGVYVATTSATDATTGVLRGQARLTIAIGAAETGNPPGITAAPKSNAISKVKLKGKFSFAAADTLQPLAAGSGSDQVTFTGGIELPAGEVFLCRGGYVAAAGCWQRFRSSHLYRGH